LAKYKNENDAEGVVYPGTYISGNEKPDQNVFLLINASRPEEWDQIKYREKGGDLFDGYAYLGVDEKTRMHVRFSVVDRQTKSPVILPEFDVTFFNLGYGASTKNHVKVYNPSVVMLSQKTSITKVKNSDNSWTFHSVYKDYFSGSISRPYPDDPVRLHTKERERAVTIQYFDTDHFEVELWGETVPGKQNHGVGWSMIFGPNLKCAKTIGDDLGDDPVVIDVMDNRNCYRR